ncbi:MAG TPA: CAP domain-containing protein, partial [Caulobacteraceae bacterium]|nr:CAP domain-containing protein [Caulobacteraceae bacterium]
GSSQQLQDTDAGVLAEINWVRAHPADYAAELRAYETHFRGKIAYEPGDPVGVVFTEGVAAVEEAADYVAAQPPRPPLRRSELLSVAAHDHAREQAATGALGHIGPDGSTPSARVQRRGGGRYVGEIIAYGAASPAAMVRLFIVDDGVPGRGHRTAVFSDQYSFAGVGCGDHSAFGHMCVVDLAMTPDGNLSQSASQ